MPGQAAQTGPSDAFNFDAAYAYIIAINQLLHLGRDPVRYKAKFFWRRCVDCVSPAPQVRSILMRTATVLAPINSLTCRARAAQGRLSQPPTALSLRISNFSISWCGRMVQWGCCPLQNCMRVTRVSTRKGSPDNARSVQGACSASGGLLLCLRPVREVRLLLTLE